MAFFEASNPSVPRCGAPGVADNQAEWIVDLTTKVSQWPGCFQRPGMHRAVLASLTGSKAARAFPALDMRHGKLGSTSVLLQVE